MLLALLLLLSGLSSPERAHLCPTAQVRATMAAAEQAPPPGAPVPGRTTTIAPGLQRQVVSARHGRASAVLGTRFARIVSSLPSGETRAERRLHLSFVDHAPSAGRAPPAPSAS